MGTQRFNFLRLVLQYNEITYAIFRTFEEEQVMQVEDREVAFRADAAFAKPEIYEALPERGVTYAIRVPANDSLERDIFTALGRSQSISSQCE